MLPGAAENFAALASAQLRQLHVDSAAKARALAAGRDAAALVLRKRENDRWGAPDERQSAIAALSAPLRPSSSAGAREPKSPWLAARPFVLKNAEQFEAAPPYWTDLDGRLVSNAGLTRAKIFDGMDRAPAPDVLEQFWSRPTITIRRWRSGRNR